ncbi:hypothetical protein MATL_G00154900 [Megalops atlanticus]|uniref:C2H2-type domain-containing protein n=1 Tax=Megalops atlanticus TaxID=7932 RepID=A0A9D3T3B1_MEGAT|nr:hypothetical protein MATL_G00154900 [Megalops atlanticus]
MDAPNSGSYQGEDPPKEQRPLMDAVSVTPFDRPPVIERLQGNVGKRKSTTPQKFVGEKLVRYSYPELPHDVSLKYDREEDLFKAHMMDSAISYLGADALRPFLPHPSISAMNPLFTQPYPLGPRDAPPPPPTLLEFPPTSNSPIALARPKNPQPPLGESPSNSRPDSAESELNSPPERTGHPPNHIPRPESSPAYGREESQEGAADRAFRGGAFRVFAGDGREVKAFRCGHCRVLFLDHVMYTIHMGCHGYRDPLECNICGHHSQDRYEFSSHIVRGEHTFR